MYPKLIISPILLFATVVVSQTFTSLNPSQSNALISAEILAFATITSQPEFTSIILVLETAVPSGDLDAIKQGGAIAGLSLIDYGSSPPAWFTSLPSNVQTYLLSIATVEASIVSNFYASLTMSTMASSSTTPSVKTQTSQPSQNVAPAVTGIMAAGVAGAIGAVVALL